MLMATKSYIFLLFCLVLGLFFFFLTNSNLGCSSVLEESESLSIRDGATTSTTNTGTPGDTTSPTTAPGAPGDTTNTTAPTNGGDVAVPDTTPPTAPTNLTPANGTTTGDSTPDFTWRAATDAVGVTGYEITLDGTLITQEATASYTPIAALVPGLHNWQVRARDAAGNWGPKSASTSFTVDTNLPTVLNVTSTTANGTYGIGTVIPITVTFSEPVIVTGTPYDELETGANDRHAIYASGTGTATLTFNYIVQSTDTTADLNYTGTDALNLNSGTIRDAVGNNATLTLSAPGAAHSLGDNKTIEIDTVAPTIRVSSLAADNVYVEVTFSKDVYTAAEGGNLTLADFSIAISNGRATVTAPTLTRVSASVIRVNLNIIGYPNGTETITITPANSSSIYDAYGNPMADDQTTGLINLHEVLWSIQTIAGAPQLNAVALSGAIGYAVGNGGTILSLTDGTWSSIESPTPQNLNGVDFYTANYAWIAGANGTILNNSTGTFLSTIINPITNESFSDIAAGPDNRGSTIGLTGIIYDNGGGGMFNHSNAVTEASGTQLNGVDFYNFDFLYDEATIWAVGNSGTLTYFDLAGFQWVLHDQSGSITTRNLEDVDFFDDTHGWAVGDNGTILFYNGVTWATQVSTTSQNLKDVCFVTADDGWAVGENGTILYTRNGGTTWTRQLSGTTQHLYGIDFSVATIGVIVGAGGTILTYIH